MLKGSTSYLSSNLHSIHQLFFEKILFHQSGELSQSQGYPEKGADPFPLNGGQNPAL
jgi:hypothetical protein